MKERFKRYFAEFFGTMFLVLFGCGTAMAVGTNAKQGSGYILTALAFGLVLMVLSYSICKKSGCHVNPAVSLAMLMLGELKIGDFFGYVVAQIGGSFGACGLLTVIFFGHTSSYGANVYYDDEPWVSLLIEVILTVLFVSAVIIASQTKEHRNISGIISGTALILVHIMGIQLTGTSVNPARSLAPAVFAGGRALSESWVFIVAPLVGAVIAVFLCKWLVLEKDDDIKEDEEETAEENVTEDDVDGEQ